MASQRGKKSSLLKYGGNLMEKRGNQSREEEDDETDTFNQDSVVNKTDERDFQHTNLENHTSESTDIDYDQLTLDSDAVIETRAGDEKTDKQPVYLRLYQSPTPEPVDIQIQEILLQPSVQWPAIQGDIEPNKNRDEQSTPSPILITSAPPEPPVPSTNKPIFYNKYIPVNYQQQSEQIVISHYPEVPAEPQPIVVEHWLPNKPSRKLITSHDKNQVGFIQNGTKRLYHRYIEYKKPHTITEVEIIRLPIMKIDFKEYETRSNQLTQLDYLRSLTQDLDLLHWRI